MQAGVVERPEFGALVFGVPLAEFVAEGEDALFGAGFFFVAPRATHQCAEAVLFDGFEQCDGLGGVAGVGFAPQHHRAFGDGVFHAADDEPRAGFPGGLVAEGYDFGVVVAGVDVHQREGQRDAPPGHGEGFAGEGEQDDGVFAAGKQDGGVAAFGQYFADDVDGFGFEPVEVVILQGGAHGGLSVSGWLFGLRFQAARGGLGLPENIGLAAG